MPESSVPETENKKLADRIKKLEDAVSYLMKGAKRVEKEISSEWGESTYEPAEHFGVRID
jgi:hypothetical protein